MKPHAIATLDRLLAIAKSSGADELRLMSGRGPVFIVANVAKDIGEPELTASLVRDIHLTCLTMAKGEIPTSKATLAYRIISKTLGPVRCTYIIHGRARTLTLVPDGEETENLLIDGHGKPPPLRVAAKVERKLSDNGDEDAKSS